MMTIKRWGLILALIAMVFVGVSSGWDGGWGWSSVPPEANPSNLSPFGYIAPFNLSEYLYPESNAIEEDETFQWEPVPIVMPQPLPISKDELFSSYQLTSPQKGALISSMPSGAVISTQKQSLISAYSSGFPSLFF